MSNDKLFQKRKARGGDDLRRKKAKRAPYDRVLIVCEGSKSEPKYLSDLIDSLKLNNANLEICGECGSDPKSIFFHAKNKYLKEKRRNDAYDRVFCVFDRDQHAKYDEVKNIIASHTPAGLYRAITSVPCFEYFILLHFEYSTAPYEKVGKRSGCDCVIQRLNLHLPNYGKGSEGLFAKTYDKLDYAISNCEKAMKASQNVENENPSTLMHELVEYLQKLARN